MLVGDLERSFRAGDRDDQLEIGLHRRLAAGGLHEQARQLRVGGCPIGVHRRDRPGVEELESRHPGAGADERGGRPTCRIDVGKGDPERDNVLGDPVEPQGQLGDHRERALRADEQPRHVISRGGLRRLRTRCGSLARPEAPPRARARSDASSRSESSSCRPRSWQPCRRGVASAPGSTGNIKAVGTGGRIECAASRAWLHHGEQVGGLATNSAHPAQIEADAACDRDQPLLLEAGPCAEGGHGDAPLVCELENTRDLRASRSDRRRGPAGRARWKVRSAAWRSRSESPARDPRRIVEHRRDGVRE